MSAPSDPLLQAKSYAAPVRELVQRIRSTEAETYGHRPRPGSEALADIENNERCTDGSPWGSEPVVEAQSMPGLRLFAADDHLFALSELVGSQYSMLGWAVSCRNVLEAASRAWWLLEPRIGTRERIVRYLADAFQSEQYRGELMAGIGGTSKPGGVKPIIAKARSLGIEVTPDNQGALFNDVRVPPPAKLVHGLLDDAGFDAGEGFYRYLSGTTHGDRQAILDILEAKHDTTAGEHQAGPQIHHVRLIVQITLTGYAAAVMRSWAYQGWDPGEIRSLLKQALDTLNR